MLTSGFTTFHKDEKIRDQLGRGFVVGELAQTTTIQTKGQVEENGVMVDAIITRESVELYYQVLWENARLVSPSLHKSTDLIWEMLTEDFLSFDADEDDEDEDEEDDENEEYDTMYTTQAETAALPENPSF